MTEKDLDQTHFTLNKEEWDELNRLLNAPIPDVSGLRKLLCKTPRNLRGGCPAIL